EDKVRVVFREVAEVGLRALHVALARHTAAAHGDHALNGVPTAARRVLLGAENRHDAIALIGLHDGPSDRNHGNTEHDYQGEMPALASGGVQHGEQNRRHGGGGAQVRLLENENGRNGHDNEGDDEKMELL